MLTYPGSYSAPYRMGQVAKHARIIYVRPHVHGRCITWANITQVWKLSKATALLSTVGRQSLAYGWPPKASMQTGSV